MSDVLFAPAGTSPDIYSHPMRPRRFSEALKICFISETLQAGVGRHIVDAISALSAAGHEIHLLYSPNRFDPEFLATLLKQTNVVCRALPMPRPIGVLDIAAFNRIAAHVRANGPFDIVHGHSAKGGGYARLLKLLIPQPVVYSPHAFITASPALSVSKRAIYHVVETILARLTDRVVCCSSAEQDHARRFGFSNDRLNVIAHGSAPCEAPPRHVIREELGFSSDQIVVGFVGRMEAQKAPGRLIAAARRLLPQMPQLAFLMIGDGPLRADLDADLHRAGLSDRVLWLGATDARRYFPAMDMLALCSLYEGLAYVILEALFAGLPIISTPVGGTRETISDGVNGIIVPHDAPEKIEGAIRRLATDTQLRRSMASASRQRAEQFTIPRMVEALEHLYFEIRKRTAGARPAQALVPLDVPTVS